MRSDLASMRASGGGAPKFQTVAVPGLTLDKEYKAGNVQSSQQAWQRPQAAPVAAPAVYEPQKIPVTHEVGSPEDIKSHLLPIEIVVVVAIAALAAVGYVAYTVFAK